MDAADEDHLPKYSLCSRINRCFMFACEYVHMYIFYLCMTTLQWRCSALLDLTPLAMKHCLKLSNIALIP